MNEIKLKTAKEIEFMRQGGRIAASVLKKMSELAKAGVNIKDLDKIAEEMILSSGAKPSFKGFHGYPATSCISVNDQVVHGIPIDRILKNGDIVGFDIGVLYQGFHTDTAITVPIGEVSDKIKKLIGVTYNSLYRGIDIIRPGIHLGDVQAEIQKEIEDAGFMVIRDLTGHGVGRELQEAPSIPNYGKKGTGLVLKEGMTLAIEPMTAMHSYEVEILSDGWTIVTADQMPSAHFEHTIAVTKDGYEILTKIQ